MSLVPPERVPEWTIGDRLWKARTVAGFSQSELAEYFGMARISLSRYEQGHNRPPLYILRLWAERCEVSLDWLRYGDVPPQPELVADTAKPPRKRRSGRRTVASKIDYGLVVAA